jgi:MoaA/NifB/PqqE/SkfB family radical SAM enzyme
VNHLVESLPVVILYPHSRCNCRCIMCDIWKDTRRQEISAEQFERYLDDFRRLRVEWVVFSGGEPLMHSNLFPICARLRGAGMRVTILSTGLLLERDASKIVDAVDDVIVSLDGPPAIHDRIRCVPDAFQKLERGVRAIHGLRAEYPIAARSVVQRENFRHMRETLETAERLGLRSISFLAADVDSSAFNRPDGWPADVQNRIALSAAEIRDLEAEITALVTESRGSALLDQSEEKLRAIARHYRARLGLAPAEAPRCNAPWVSAVIEADGVVRPCFFHAPIGHAREGLAAALNSPAAIAFRASLDVSTNATCRNCVCSLNWKGPRDAGKKGILGQAFTT